MSSYIELIRSKYATNYINPNGAEHMCIDLDGVTERISTKVKPDLVFKTVWNEIVRYIKSYSNLKSLFIVSRGVVSTAELQQLRIKAFSTTKNSNFDPNSINPGTEFKKKLENSIRNYLSNNKTILPHQTTFSDSTLPGSVSDKIRDHIQPNTICYNVDIHTVYTLLRSGIDFIFADYGGSILPISSIRENAIYVLGVDKWNSLLFMMYCVTERFMPRITAFADPTTTFNILIELIESNTLVEDDKVLWKNVMRVLAHLSAKERTLLLVSAKSNSSLYDKSLIVGDFDYSLYRKLYYTDRVELMVENYLELMALSWSNDKEEINRSLYYRFNMAPLLGDLFSIGKNIIVNVVRGGIWREESVTPSLLPQLAQLLPMTSYDVLPVALLKEMRKNKLLMAAGKADKILEMRLLNEPLFKFTKLTYESYSYLQSDDTTPNLFILENRKTLIIPDPWSIYLF